MKSKVRGLNMAKDRAEIPLEDRWNVEALYPSWDAWEKDFDAALPSKKSPHWPELQKFKGKIATGAQTIATLLDLVMELDRRLNKLFTYAHLRHDEDVADELAKNAYQRITTSMHEYRSEISWMEPEFLALPDDQINKILQDSSLSKYKIYLEKILRLKPHTLSADKEELLAIAGKALSTAYLSFGAFNNADLKFSSILDGKGNQRELTHGKYQVYLRESDRTLRENAFKGVHSSFGNFENTLCELLNGQVQTHLFEARARNYSSCLQSALFPNQIDPQVYHALISTVRAELPSLHRYMKLRKELLGYDTLQLWDLHCSLVPNVEKKILYNEACDLVQRSVAPLGSEYQNILSQGLGSRRWVDRYENTRKRSGAYSSGCYDSMPYILMNYQGTLSDAMTLAHEAGHSMHSYYSHQNQPYHYSHYPIFLAEVASTFNEELLFRLFLENEKDPVMRSYLINQKIDDIRATFFRQTMFAEFELQIHTWAEEGKPLTPALLKEYYYHLNRDYFGPDVEANSLISIEWARIPHFYYNFYVYQYATGISAAFALVDKLDKLGDKARNDYFRFLSSGSSKFPLDILKEAGVDMCSPEPVKATIHQFDHLVSQLSESLSKRQ